MSVSLALKLWQMKQPTVACIGDCLLDVDIHGTCDRFAQEAPGMPVFREHHRVERAGGADAVAEMCKALGAKVGLESGRASVKTRYFVDDRLMWRHDLDVKAPEYWVAPTRAKIVADTLKRADIVVIADYAKGVCADEVLRAAIDGARARGIPCLVDPARGECWFTYKGATAIKCNLAEWASDESGEWYSVANDVIITRGADGLGHKFFRSQDPYSPEVHYPARQRNAVCVLGCGDMVLAALGVCLAGGMTWGEACVVANAAAGCKVEKRGAVPVSRAEVCIDLCHGNKTLPMELLPAVRALASERKQRIVWTNGCYDHFHNGHLHCLQEAKRQGDILVVGINDDASVRVLKGALRPLVPLQHRIASLAALSCVDWVVPFGLGLHCCIELLRPDVLSKGAEYTGTDIPGAAFVEKNGGRVHLVPMLPGFSTTALAAKDAHEWKGTADDVGIAWG